MTTSAPLLPVLLPCPWCGSPAELDESTHPETADVMYKIQCGDNYGERNCPVSPSTFWESNYDLTIKRWNRRAKPAMPSVSDEVVRVAQHARCNAEKIYTVQCEYENKEPDYPTMSNRAMRAALEAAIQAMNEASR